jgi:hypothetical protein
MYTSSLLEVTGPGKSAPAKKSPTIAMVGVAKKTPVAPAAASQVPAAIVGHNTQDLPKRRCALIEGPRGGLTDSDMAARSRRSRLQLSLQLPATLRGLNVADIEDHAPVRMRRDQRHHLVCVDRRDADHPSAGAALLSAPIAQQEQKSFSTSKKEEAFGGVNASMPASPTHTAKESRASWRNQQRPLRA